MGRFVPSPASADWVVPLGETVPLPEPMAGWTVAVSGWTEVDETGNLGTGSGGGYVQPIEGSRLVAALIEWCYLAESDGGRPVPTFGIQIDGWNLMGDFQRGSPWGAGFEELQLAPPQGCASGWQAFEVPLGSEPSGMFVSDNNNSDAVWREWHFGEGARLAPPEGGGLGSATAEALSVCGVTEPLQVVSDGAEIDGTIASAVAIPTGPSRLDVYLSSSEISEADIPRPVDAGVSLVALGLEQTDGSSIAPGVFTDQVTGTQYGTVSAVPGGVEAGVRIFLGATVELTEVTPTHVCGSISATSGSDSVSGRFGAPVNAVGG